MGRFALTALKGVGYLLLAVVALSAITTIIGLVVSLVTTLVSLLMIVAVLAVFVLAAVGLWSLVRDDEEHTPTDRKPTRRSDDSNPEERLRERYVAGEISDAEFERQLDLLLETRDTEAVVDQGDRNRTTERTRLWE